MGLHHFNSPSQGQAHKTMERFGRETMCAQNDKGMQTQAFMNEATMNYSFLTLQFLPFQCIQRVPYIVLQWGNGRSNLSDLKAYGRPRDK